MRLAPVFTLCLLLSAPLHAQQVSAPDTATKPKETSRFGKFSTIFNGPLHPIFRGVVAGGGIGVGLRYDFPTIGHWQTAAHTVITLRRYWSAELETVYRGRRGRVSAHTRIREMTQLSYFGPGIESGFGDRTNFLMRDPVVGVIASARAADWMSAGVRVEEIWPNVGRGLSSLYPSVEDRFGESDAPGLTAQPRFGRYQGFVDLQAPASVGQNLNQGGRYRIAYSLFNDQKFDRFSFTRIDLEGRHKFALFGAHRRLTLRGWVATTDTTSGHEIPFYLQPSLGGTGQLRSFGEDLIGTDGSRGTLRGFENYRFRDRHLMLLQADYRVPVWGPIDASVFVDAGKVTARRADLNFSGLKRDYGFSVSMMRGASTMARAEFGFGSGESTRVAVMFGLGDDFLP